ncbi:hypothetical protein FBQ81_04930 [Chloroflexi bacterium CFX6]|nr:hypothetical protein [Chloroflexi bacterium CFX6]
MGAIGVVSLIIALICYWGFGWSGLASAAVGVILGPVIVAVFQVTFSSLFGAKEGEASAQADKPNPPVTPPNP